MADPNLTKKGVPICDETYTLKVSKDKLQAFIIPKEGVEGIENLNLEEFIQELKSKEVVFGVLEKPKPKGDGTFLVAQGVAQINGENAKFKTHIKPSVVRAPKSRKPGQDRIDYRELGSIVNVPKDKLLIEKIPATPGTEGQDVFGQTLNPKPGKDISMKVGQGVELSEDGMKATSIEEGKFMLADGKASVITEHTITGDVDLTVGNIAFVGKSLVINGSVLPGFRVKCKQDIHIAKGVENAEVVAGGTISIKGGVVGADVVLQSWSNIEVDFVENIKKIELRGTLTLTDSIIQAHVKAGKDVIAMQGKGTLIGGSYVVGGSVHVKELGSDAEVITDLCVGINPELEEKKKKLDADKAVWPEKMSENLKNTTALKKMQKEEGANFPQEKKDLLQKLNDQLPFVMDKVNEITVREEAMEEEIAKTIGECVYVYNKAFPGVKITIGGHTRILASEENQVVIYFDKQSQKIKLRPMTSEEKAFGE